jgi:hypothetical protein
MRLGLLVLMAVACSSAARKQTNSSTGSTTAGTTGTTTGGTTGNTGNGGDDMMSLDEDMSMSGDFGAGAYGDLAINGDAGGCAPGQTPQACPTPAPANAGCGGVEICGNGLDDNCDGHVDENCSCTPGSVQPCFLGPPGKRGIGACTDGTQTCTGPSEFGTWGDCVGSIGPSPEVCDKLDNDCDGCPDDGLCCGAALDCPGPNDPRIAPVKPYTDKALQGGMFFFGSAATWSWTVEGGPCDKLFASPDFTPVMMPPPQSFTLTNANTQNATVHFTLSGDYTITLTVVDTSGVTWTCKWVQHVIGPGIRFELCWDHQGTAGQNGADLDLHVHKYDGPTTTPWFETKANTDNPHDCFYENCTASSYFLPFGATANFGYGNTSPDDNCKGSKYGSTWDLLGYCHNPRLDLDNVSDVGVPENTNIDNPPANDTFRAAVHYYGQGGRGSTKAVDEHPIVNIYCGGTLKATYGQKPDQIPNGFNFGTARDNKGFGLGMIWRVADVQATGTDAMGNTTCTITPLHPPMTTSGYWVVTSQSNTDFSY